MVSDCGLAAVGNGHCRKHYTRQARYGTTDMPERPTVCVVNSCGRSVDAKSLCDKHYRRHRAGSDAPRYCGWCGVEIDPNVNAQRRFCSKECKERNEFIQRREGHRGRWLKRYGLTPGQFDARLVEQGGRCKICGTTEVPARGSFCVDHDHATGVVRGLLCAECNKGLGQFKDSPELLRAAIDYLTNALTASSI